VVHNILTPGGESAILMAADRPGTAVCKSTHGVPPRAPATSQTATSKVAVAEISQQILATRAADRADLCQVHIRLLIDKGTIAVQRVGFVWLVSIPSREHYMANSPRPGWKLGQKITRLRRIAAG
jgi:hypothetical protein